MWCLLRKAACQQPTNSLWTSVWRQRCDAEWTLDVAGVRDVGTSGAGAKPLKEPQMMGKINVVLFQSRMIFLSTVPGPLLSIEYKRIICQPPAHSSTLKKIQKNHEINLEIKVDHPVPFCCGVQTVPEMLPATGGDDNLQHNLPSLCSAGWYRPHCLHPFVLQVCIDLTVTSLLFCRLV